MEKVSEVRLVRCPKCENLLPESPDLSVYQCGGCGAVLRAKKKGPVSEGLSAKSDEERGRGGSEKRLGVSLESASETEIDGLGRGRKKERAFPERAVNLLNSRSFNHNTRREAMNLRVDQSDQHGEVGYYKDRYAQCSKRPINYWVYGNDHEVNMNRKRSESSNSCVESKVNEIKHSIGDFAGSSLSSPVMDQWGAVRNGSGAFYGSGRGVSERRRFSTFPYPDDGSSNYWPGSFHGYAEQKRVHHELDGPSSVEYLEHDRAELLRKLDELKDQLSRSCDVTEKPRERVPVDRMMAPPPPPPSHPPPPPHPLLPNRYCGHDSRVPERPTSLYPVNVQSFAPDKHVPEPLYCNHNHGPVPSINSRVFDMQDFYPPPRNVPNEFGGYEGSYLPQRLRRHPYQPPPQYMKQPYHVHFPGQHMDFNQSTLTSDQHETFLQQPACSCLQCYNKNWQIPPTVPHPTMSSRFPTDPTNPISHHLVSSVTYGPQGHNSRGANPPYLHSLTRQPQTRSSSDLDSEIGGLGHRRPRRVVVSHGSERVCHPMAGGAPFLTCYSCFGLLKLPRKLMAMGKNEQKVRCGACAAIILFEIEKKGLVVSIPTQLKQDSAEGDDGSGEMLNENPQSSHNCLNAGATNSCSDDYDNSGYNFVLTDSESNVLSRDQRLDFGESNERQDPLSSSSSFSEDEQSPDSVICRREISNSADLPPRDDVPLPLPDSPHQKDPDNASSNYVVDRYVMGNESKRNEQEMVILDRSTSRQHSVKDVSVATEMEVSFNDFLNSSISQDSEEVSKEEDRPRINKGSESFFVGLIKKSFRDFSRSSQIEETGRSNVFVNGKPISDRVVKKAEKMAGPIQPGNYWYDYRAGFWGVMGHPCLGIIPPFIEEFNYPMPENCAAGNTGVFLNGRELHQKDLDLLAGRGLPIIRDKSYIIEITGRILDEYTGEELDSLGKLAPTVERVKHGFGMKIPRALAH